MFGYNYHFTVNPVKQTIKLTPTLGTYAKAFGPAVVLGGLVLVAAAFMEIHEKRMNTLAEYEDPENA